MNQPISPHLVLAVKEEVMYVLKHLGLIKLQTESVWNHI